jgi:hypothetical protein
MYGCKAAEDEVCCAAVIGSFHLKDRPSECKGLEYIRTQDLHIHQNDLRAGAPAVIVRENEVLNRNSLSHPFVTMMNS